MFTGIITDVGRILAVRDGGDRRLRVATAYDPASIAIGASIACDGVCLTVVGRGGDPEPWFEVDVSAETVARTTFDRRGAGDRLNLERSLRVGDELGGHIVSGHVDGPGEVVAMTDEGDSTRVTIEVAPDLGRYLAPKGSVALNGTSLTVNEVSDAGGATRFGVNIIPHTKTATTWGDVAVGARMNVEIDMLARYVARLQEVA